MIKNKDFTGSLNSNPFYFNHFNLNHFTLYYNGRPVPSEGLVLDMSHEKTSVLAYNTPFEGVRHTSLERGAASNRPHDYSGVFHAAL
jgi:protein tyrosine/serine phosphatase